LQNGSWLAAILGLTLSEFAEQYPDEKVDVVTFFEELQHQASPAEFVKQVKSRLRARAYIASSDPYLRLHGYKGTYLYFLARLLQ
jgi:2-polyprenyl-3-methyl-5-hydroxy-6-metoxy-1,4-benzoquinol methylase